MSVLIQINGENAGEAIKELSALAAGIVGQAVAPVQSQEVAKPSRSRSTTKPESASSDTQVDPVNVDKTSKEVRQEAADLSDSGSENEHVPTVVELRAKAQEVGSTPEAKRAIKTLLDEFGSKSISDLPEDKRRAFMSRLEGLV